MTALQLTGQLEPVRPLSVRSWYMRNGEGDLAALKAITDAFAVPAWVRVGGGTIGSQRANLTDDQVEQCLRDALWRLINYTGVDDASGTACPSASNNHRALDIYNWINTNAALHSSKGPTIACGTIMDIYVGFLAGSGIPARKSWSHYAGGGAVDFQAEYWSPDLGWVRVAPHVNVRAEWVATGNPASLFDVASVGAQYGTLSGVIHHVPQTGSGGGAAFRSGVTENLDLFLDWALWGRGNRMQYAYSGATPLDPNITDDGNSSVGLITLTPQTASAVTAQTSAMYGFIAVARDITDVQYTPSALMASARLSPSGLAEVALDGFVLGSGITYQVKAPAGSWVTLPAPAHGFHPVSGQAWQYRAVGPLGNTTNTVTVTVA